MALDKKDPFFEKFYLPLGFPDSLGSEVNDLRFPNILGSDPEGDSETGYEWIMNKTPSLSRDIRF